MALNLKSKKNKGGRPLGSKTRPDAPSMIAKRQKLASSPVTAPETATPPPTPSALLASSAIRPDTEIFGHHTLPPENQPKLETSLPPETDSAGAGGDQKTDEDFSGNFPPENETKPDSGTPEDHRALSIVIWDSLISFLAAIMGAWWMPRKVGKDMQAGEIPFDEREMVVSAFAKYFASIGMTILSPLQELCIAVGGYVLPRAGMLFDWMKMRFMKKAKTPPPQPANDPRMPPKPPETEKPAPSTDQPAPVSETNPSSLDALRE